MRKLKYLLINPKFQLSIIAYFTVAAGIAITALYISVSLTFKRFVDYGHKLGLPKDDIYHQFIQWQHENFTLVFAIIGVFLLFSFVIGGLILSHKIAGPMYRFKTFLIEEKENQGLKELKFRDGDYFSEIPELFNEYQKSKYKNQ